MCWGERECRNIGFPLFFLGGTGNGFAFFLVCRIQFPILLGKKRQEFYLCGGLGRKAKKIEKKI